MPTSNKAKIASIYTHLKFGALPGLWTPGVTNNNIIIYIYIAQTSI